MRSEQEDLNKDKNENSTTNILFNEDNSLLILTNPKPDLCFLMLSTQPGRKIIHPPSKRMDKLCFSLEKSDGINEECQYFCSIGLANCLTDIQEIIEKSHPTKNKVKIIYISKIKIGFTASLCSHRLDSPSRKKKSYPNIYPPTELNAHQLQPMLEQFQQIYGPASQVNVKKNCLILTFEEQIEIKDHFRIKGVKSSFSGETILRYWCITSHQPLFTFQPIQLIQLPSQTHIQNFVIQGDWIVFSTSNDVLFLHLFKPMELFLTLTDVKPQAIYPFTNSRIIIFQYKYIHAYQLHQTKNPTHLGTGKTKKIQPHSIALCKNTAVVGGINYSYMLNQPNQQKQLHVFQMFTTMNFHNKNFLADRTFQICKKQPNDAVKNLTYLNDLDLFFCSCSNSIFVFHLNSESLIASVDLNGQISTIYEIDYPINLINCLVRLRGGGMLIRVSFQQYCEIMGTEVGLAENYGQPNDFKVSKINKKNVYTTDGEMIIKYYNSNSQVLFSCDEGKTIMNICITQQALVFVTEGNESLQVFFQQI